MLNLKLESTCGTRRHLDFNTRSLIVAGWTGRNGASVQRHIEELAMLGVKPPSKTPMLYPISRSLLTTHSEIEVVGASSSGEAEFCLLQTNGETYVAVG